MIKGFIQKMTSSLLSLMAYLPLGMLYILSDILRFLLQYIIRYRKRVIYGNLQRSFPEKTPAELRKIAHSFYHHLSDCIVECIKLLHLSDQELERRVTVNGGEIVEELASDGNPVILFVGHYGNWEWAQQVTRQYKIPPITVEIYRPIKNRALDEMMFRVRSKYGNLPVPQKLAVRKLLKMNKEGKQFLVALVADQRPNSKNLYHWTTFLHQDTAYAVGGEEIGRRIKAHYVFLYVEKKRRGYYKMEFQKMDIRKMPADETYPFTKRYLQLMEAMICKAPEYWLWSHNRWKYDREGNKIHK